MNKAAHYFSEELYKPENTDVLNYLKDRGLSEETIRAFRLGYAPASMDYMKDFQVSHKLHDSELKLLCLTKSSQKGGQDYAFFRDRVMFPVTDKRGRVVAFGGRVLPDHIRPPDPRSSFTPPKYINSGETPLFHKGRLVYNISNARQAAQDGQPLIVAEGYADVIALAQAGFHGAVAPLGTALTESQIEMLWQAQAVGDAGSLREPYLCFDGDQAGARAAIRAMERLLPILQPGVSARFAFMPAGLDPDDLIRKQGAGAMRAVIDKAIPLHEMIWRHVSRGHDLSRPEARASLLSEIDKIVMSIADRTIQQSYRQILKDKVYQHFRAQKPGIRKRMVTPSIPLTKPKGKGDLAVRLILGLILRYPEFYDEYEEQINAVHAQNQMLDRLRQNVISILSDTSGITHDQLIAALHDKGINGDDVADLHMDVKLHAAYALEQDAYEAVKTGLEELLNRQIAANH